VIFLTMTNSQGIVISENPLYYNEVIYDPKKSSVTQQRRLDEFSSETACAVTLPQAQVSLEKQFRQSARFFTLSCRPKPR